MKPCHRKRFNSFMRKVAKQAERLQGEQKAMHVPHGKTEKTHWHTCTKERKHAQVAKRFVT